MGAAAAPESGESGDPDASDGSDDSDGTGVTELEPPVPGGEDVSPDEGAPAAQAVRATTRPITLAPATSGGREGRTLTCYGADLSEAPQARAGSRPR